MNVYFKSRAAALRSRPFVTGGLIIINALIFLLMSFTGGISIDRMVNWGAIYPPLLTEEGQWYRLLTCCFLHFGIDHIVGNMLALGSLGERLEEMLGHVRFLLLYTLSGIGANIFSLAVDQLRKDTDYVAAGASGAVFGVLGGMLAALLKGDNTRDDIGLPQMVFAAAFLLYSGTRDGSVDMLAHVGGLALGFLLGLLLRKRR